MDLSAVFLLFFVFLLMVIDFTSSYCSPPKEEVKTIISNDGIPYIHKTYTWGKKYTGDIPLWDAKKSMRSQTFSNLHIDFEYPQQEYYATITQIKVEVDQSSALGTATCVDGGLHQDFAIIAVDAEYAIFLNATFNVYGRVYH